MCRCNKHTYLECMLHQYCTCIWRRKILIRRLQRISLYIGNYIIIYFIGNIDFNIYLYIIMHIRDYRLCGNNFIIIIKTILNKKEMSTRISTLLLRNNKCDSTKITPYLSYTETLRFLYL